jgi:GNAT superfamily N-acetyltransferase
LEVQVELASTQHDREIVEHLRYRVYVAENRFLHDVADHEHQRLADPTDANCDHFLARVDGEPVGTFRVEPGMRSEFEPKDREIYDLARFSGVVPRERMCLFTRLLVLPEYRGGLVPFRLIEASAEYVRDNGIELAFLYCEPHLLNLYLGIGFRAYKGLVDHPEPGALVPLVFVASDAAYLERSGSPLHPIFAGKPRTEVTDAVSRIIGDGAPVLSEITQRRAEQWSEAYHLLSACDRHAGLFESLDDDELERLLTRGHLIRCERGQRLIRQDKTTRMLFVILDGVLEVVDAGRLVARRMRGEVVGELALLLERPRSSDVRVGSEHARVIALSESTIRQLIESDSQLAAKLLLHLSKALCLKLIESSPTREA